MAKIQITSNFGDVAKRIIARLNKLDPDSKEFRAALFKVGTIIRNEAQRNITKSGAIDSGLLRSKIDFRLESRDGLQNILVGAFGVRYARMVEFGGVFTDEMRRAMFASFNNQGRAPRKGKGIIVGRQYRARPYLGPAVRDKTPQIRGIMMSVVRDK